MMAWFVIKAYSNNGIRLGIDEDAKNPIAGPFRYVEAALKCSEMSIDLGIPEFNNDVDTYLWEVE